MAEKFDFEAALKAVQSAIGVVPLSWTVYRLCDHKIFQQEFCIKSYTQGESSSLGAVILSSR